MFPLRDSVDHHEPSVVTKLLIGANILFFFWQLAGGPFSFQRTIFAYGFIPRLFFADPAGEAYRLISSMFMHGGLGHILGNMWFLWVFGPSLEGRLGSVRFALLYLLAGVGATLAHGLTQWGSEVPMVGASGAISGVLGAYIALYSRAWVLTLVWFVLPLFIWLPAGLYLGYWAVIQFLYALAGVPGTAWWAHLGGFLLGLLLVRVLVSRQPYRAEPYWERGTGLR